MKLIWELNNDVNLLKLSLNIDEFGIENKVIFAEFLTRLSYSLRRRYPEYKIDVLVGNNDDVSTCEIISEYSAHLKCMLDQISSETNLLYNFFKDKIEL